MTAPAGDGRLTRLLLPLLAFILIAVWMKDLAVNLWTAQPGVDEQHLGHYGMDFGGMYVAGRLLNEHGPGRLYDFDLQQQLYKEFLGLPETTTRLPFAHPPPVASLFALLAHLPYTTAYLVWLAAMLALYLAGLAVLARLAPPEFHRWRLQALAMALAFSPFVVFTWYNGQISPVGFLAFCLMLAALQTGRPFLAGLALALTLYKPTLALPWLPLLLIGRRWRVLAGFAVGVASWLALGAALAGPDCWLDYWHALQRHRANMDQGLYRLPATRFVDPFSALSLWPLTPGAQKAVGALLSAGPYLLLAGAWWRWPWLGDRPRLWLLAATFAWASVLNLYTPRSDTLPVVIAAFLLAAWPPQIPAAGARLPRALAWLLAAVFLTPLVPLYLEDFAATIRVPLYTLALAALGGYALWFVYRPPPPV